MPYAKLEGQRVAVVVDNAEKRMILPAERFEIGETAVISKGQRPWAPVKREIDDRIEENIDGTKTPAEDGPGLQGVARLLPMWGVIAQLLR